MRGPDNKLVFPNVVIRKDKNNLDKHRKDVNAPMRNFCEQENIGIIDNCNLEEKHISTTKLHLHNKHKNICKKYFTFYEKLNCKH